MTTVMLNLHPSTALYLLCVVPSRIMIGQWETEVNKPAADSSCTEEVKCEKQIKEKSSEGNSIITNNPKRIRKDQIRSNGEVIKQGLSFRCRCHIPAVQPFVADVAHSQYSTLRQHEPAWEGRGGLQ